MKKFISIVLTLVLCVNLTCGMSFAQDLAINEDAIEVAGLCVSKEGFKETFSGEPSSRKALTETRSLSDPKILIDDVIINNDVIRFTAYLTIGTEKTSLYATGQLCSGIKNQHGFNSIIVNIPKSIEGYNILLFEIFNDIATEKMVNSLTGKLVGTKAPYIKIYIQDIAGNIYLFETEMPTCFNGLDASNYENAPKEKDLLWAMHLVEHEISQVPINNDLLSEVGDENQSRGLGNITTWTPGTMNRDTFYVGSDKGVCYSLPSLKYKHTNITTSTSTWHAEFNVAESVQIGGYTYYGTNVFKYRNLKIAFTRGDNTHILRTMQQGRVYDNYAILNQLKENGERIAVQLLKKTVTKLPGGATVAEALSFVNSMTSVQDDVYLGQDGLTLLATNVTAAGENLTNKYSISDSSYQGGSELVGHYFILQADLSYEYENSNVNTTGGLFLYFDTYCSSTDTTTTTKQFFPLEYTARNV